MRAWRHAGHARLVSLLVGTSGFDYKDWRGPFYPRFLKSGDRLAFYAEHFDTVELNVTFYRMPKAEAFRGWRDAVPDEFRFAVKASRYLTHIKRLEDPQGPVEFLMERASELGDKLGVVLLQLPPSLEIDLDRLRRHAASIPRSRCRSPSSRGTRAGSCRSCASCSASTTRHSSWRIVAGRSRRSGARPTGRTCGSTRGEPPHGRATAGERSRAGSTGWPRYPAATRVRLLQQRPSSVRRLQRPDIRADRWLGAEGCGGVREPAQESLSVVLTKSSTAHHYPLRQLSGRSGEGP